MNKSPTNDIYILKIDMWMIVRPTVITKALIPVDGYRYESA